MPYNDETSTILFPPYKKESPLSSRSQCKSLQMVIEKQFSILLATFSPAACRAENKGLLKQSFIPLYRIFSETRR